MMLVLILAPALYLATSDRLNDAFERVQEAASVLGCGPRSLKTFENPSDKDVFFECDSPEHGPIFFKAHLGDVEQLRGWPEPDAAAWAEGAGCGAQVFQTGVPGILATRRLLGTSMTQQQGHQEFFIRQVAEALRKLHEYEPGVPATEVPCITGGARARIHQARKLAKLDTDLANSLLATADWIDEQLAGYTVLQRRLFGDANFGNWVVVDQKIVAVDLADSHYGDPYADLARYAYSQKFDHEQLKNLLRWYLHDANDASVEAQAFRRLRLHTMAQNLDYYAYFVVRCGPDSDKVRSLARRLAADHALEAGCPWGTF